MLMRTATYSSLAQAAQRSTHIVGVDDATEFGDVTLAKRHAH